jgi:hypothetical protein
MFDPGPVQQFFLGPAMEYPLITPDVNIWGEVHGPGSYAVVAPRPRDKSDRFTGLLAGRVEGGMH